MTALADLSAYSEQARAYRANGWWRDQTFLDDLVRWALVRPDAPALVTGRAGQDAGQVLSYLELDQHVRRFAGALSALGVTAGDVVAVQLPDWWETAALLLACMRIGAIAQPMVPELRERELARLLGRTAAKVCVVPDRWAGFEHASALAEMAPRLPALRHRVVVGDAAGTGAIEFTDHFLGADVPADSTAWPVLDPDQVCLVLFTSGSTGEAKGVLHSFNTIYAGTQGITKLATAADPDNDRAAITARITHIAGPLWSLFGTLLTGGAGVYQDSPDPDRMLDLVDRAGVTRLLTSPHRLPLLVDAQRRRPRRLASLHTIATGGSPVPPGLVATVQEVFGTSLRAVWGMTEVVVGTIVGADDPPGWSAHSDGRALPGLELDVQIPAGADRDGAGSAADTGELRVRGASLCLGVVTGDLGQAVPTSGRDWFSTGDLARLDGRGGIRIVGRVVDRVIGGNGFMIPVRDVEDELLRHPKVADVAIVCADDSVIADVCAVVVPSGPRPTLDELTEHLRQCGMTELYHPSRVEFVAELPRNHLGKVRKYQLREQFAQV